MHVFDGVPPKSVGAPVLEQEPQATQKQHLDSSVIGGCGPRDSPASSHGRSGFSWPQVQNILMLQRRQILSTWVAYVGMPRRYLDVVSPCDEAGRNSQGTPTPELEGTSPRTGSVTQSTNPVKPTQPTDGNSTLNATQPGVCVVVVMVNTWAGVDGRGFFFCWKEVRELRVSGRLQRSLSC